MRQSKRLKVGVIATFIVLAAGALLTAPKSPFRISGLVDVGGGLTEPGAEKVWAIDHFAGSVDPNWYAARKNDGVRIVFQTLWTGVGSPWSACESLQAAKNVDLAIVGYISLSNAYYGAKNVDYGYNVCPQFWHDFLFVVIDIEMYLDNPVDQIQQAIDRVKELGQVPVIYTSWGMWNRYALGVSDFNNLAIWNALWDSDPDIDYQSHPYGGFQVVACEQYQNDYTWDGITVDLSICDKRLVEPKIFCDPAWVPWDGYGKDVGWWFSGDLNGDGIIDFIHVVSVDYAHPWFGKADDPCTYNVGYMPSFDWNK